MRARVELVWHSCTQLNAHNFLKSTETFGRGSSLLGGVLLRPLVLVLLRPLVLVLPRGAAEDNQDYVAGVNAFD